MPDFRVILVLLLGSLIVGALLFIPMRWLAMRKAPAREKLPSVTRGQYLQTVFIVVGLLVLAWLMESGSKAAGLIFATVMLVASVWGGIIVRKAKSRTDDSET